MLQAACCCGGGGGKLIDEFEGGPAETAQATAGSVRCVCGGGRG